MVSTQSISPDIIIQSCFEDLRLFAYAKSISYQFCAEDGTKNTVKVVSTGCLIIYRKKTTKKKENDPSFVDMINWGTIVSHLQSIINVIVDATDTNYYQITMPNIKILCTAFYNISYIF